MQKGKENTVFYDVLASRAQQKSPKYGSKTDQNRFPKASYDFTITSSTAQGSGGSFNNREPIGEVGCCGSRMAERIH